MKQSTKLKTKPKLNSNHNLSFEATGTLWTIDIYESIDTELISRLEIAIKKRIAAFENNYSRFRSDSMVSKMAKRAGVYSLPADAKKLIDTYQVFYKISDGAMTPLVGQVLSDAGYDANYAFKPKPLNSPPKWDEVLDYDFPLLTLSRPALLDFGAAGKGYLVDIVGRLIKRAGVSTYCVDAGGDILYHNKSKTKIDIGLEHPDQPGQVIGIANIVNKSLCGSAGNRRAWSGYNHIIDTRNLKSPTHIKALWVIAKTTLLADALTTALYFLPAKQLLKGYNFEYAILYQNFSMEHSQGFSAKFFAES